MTLPAILVIIPTTAGPLRLRSLTPRPGLPAAAAFADGDYRPLPWSADYAGLCAPGGPLARLTQADLPPHELRLTGSFDAGRSWEVPVCLAHGLIARGHSLAAEPAQADLILWATGAVDRDLAVRPGDYALLDKIERSRALLGEAPDAALAVLLPEGPERHPAEAAFGALGRQRAPLFLPAHDVAAALAALTRPAEEAPEAPAVVPRRRLGLALSAGALMAASLAALVVLGTRQTPVAGLDQPPAPPPAEPAAPARSAEVTPAAPPALHVEALRPPAGSSCRRVAFGAEPPDRRPVSMETPDRFASTRLAPDLCGIAVRADVQGMRVEVGPELRAAALPPVRLADGRKPTSCARVPGRTSSTRSRPCRRRARASPAPASSMR